VSAYHRRGGSGVSQSQERMRECQLITGKGVSVRVNNRQTKRVDGKYTRSHTVVTFSGRSYSFSIMQLWVK
jgi:hypothetical protein